MSTDLAIRDSSGTVSGSDTSAANVNSGLYSSMKEKTATRGSCNPRLPIILRRLRHFLGAAKLRILLGLCLICVLFLLTSKLSFLMGWISHHPSSVSSASRGGYTVLINTWKRNSLLKKSVAHYASCDKTEAIHVVWSESDLPSTKLKANLKNIVLSKSKAAHKPNFKFDINEEDDLNNRFKPIKYLSTDAIFSVDDDVIVPCSTLNFAFTVWQSAPSTMVGFVPRMHWLDGENNNLAKYKYGGWWSVWWMGTYSMVLSKAAFFHRKYLDLYTYEMPSSIRDYVTQERVCNIVFPLSFRNCEDIAMSLLVANASSAPPIWVKGKIYEIGSSGISSLNGHNKKRNICLNDFISLFGKMPLVPTNARAVDAEQELFW